MKKLVLIFSLMFLFGIMALSFMIVSAETITVPSSGGGGGGGSSCVDSDGGINYFQKGYVPMSCAAGATCGVDSDYCKDDKILVEYSCGKQECTTTSNCPNSSVSSDGNGTGQGSCGQVTTCKTVGSSQEYICPDGCSNGACLREASQTCIDSDGGKNYYTKGIAKGIYGSCEDSCITQPNGENWIHECYCDENNPWSASVATACPQGSVCTDGKCQGDVLDMDKCLNDPSNYWDQEANKCFPGYSEHVAQQLCSDPDGGKNILEYAHTYGFRSSYADERDKRIRTGGADGCYNGQLIEYYCDENGYIQTEYINCPNGCDLNSKGTCVRGELITEKITCKFEDTDKEQKCYLAGQFTDADLGTKYCIAAAGPGSCVIAYTGYEGELVTWKSTCGQYQYTTQDGNDEVIYFKCSEGETNITQILNRGFRNVYFQCYDGAESKSTDREACKSAEYWKKFAENFCQSHCSDKTGKCGVNTFSIGDECYLGEDASGGPVQYGECGDDICDSGENTPSYPYYCPQDCKQECKQDSDCSQPDCGEETDCVGIEQYKCVNGKCVSGTTEPALVCKNSCPLDGKCYPFGYRKGGKFCSDEGNFVEQGKSGACDNNFECASNVCVNSECISEGFLQKIMNWFRKMFGG